MEKKFLIDSDYSNSRLDKWFKFTVKNLPQSLIEKLLRKNKIKVNRKKVKSSYRLKDGDLVEVYDIDKFKNKVKDEKFQYKASKKEKSSLSSLVLEDNENFIVINKPCGLAVQSGTKSPKNLIDILKNTKFFDNQKPFIVHRIDKDTSGLLMIAKNREYAQLLTSLFRLRKIHKTYLAISNGSIDNSIKNLKDELFYYENKKKFSQSAFTNIKILKKNEKYTLSELNPITGRKHQLRKQLFNIGNSVVGDAKYNITKRNSSKQRLMLHAYKLKFKINDIKYNFKAPYDKSFEEFIKKNI